MCVCVCVCVCVRACVCVCVCVCVCDIRQQHLTMEASASGGVSMQGTHKGRNKIPTLMQHTQRKTACQLVIVNSLIRLTPVNEKVVALACLKAGTQ